MERLRRASSQRRPRPATLAGPHLSHLAGLLPAHGRPGYRGPGPGPERRGLPGTHLLGRAIHLPVPQLPAAGDHARVPYVPLPAPGRSPRRRERSRLQRGDVPLAERLRRAGRDTSRPPQPKLRQVGAGPLPQPAARKRRHLLQHLALLPRHRRLRVPARRRGRDDAGDRPLLVFYSLLQRRAGPVRDPRRHGPRRVPREVPGLGRRRLDGTMPTPT